MLGENDMVSMFMDLHFPPLDTHQPTTSYPLYQRHRNSRSSSCSETPSTISSAFSGQSSGYRSATSPVPSYGHPDPWATDSLYNQRLQMDYEKQLKQLEEEIFEMLFVPTTSRQATKQQPLQPQKDIEAEVLEELLQTRTSVPTDYTCHRCGVKGHWIKHCPTKNYDLERTPYQGNRPSIGFFRCQCSRHWQKEAIANRPQPCMSCRRPVFPHKMMPKPQ